jgi:catechol 2,3-dioxygenase-like lactoylglutathione lyase family enzyme
MIDHLGISVHDYEASKAFYLAALAPLGITMLMEITPEMSGREGHFGGLGKDGKPFFWISKGEPHHIHLAFAANSHAEVDAFYAAAIAAGATDNGAPGPRPHYHPGYYGAFVTDPNGVNLEAVCHRPE